jgi:hypothetical protein
MPQEYIIYGVIGLLVIIFLIITIRPRKTKENDINKSYEKYESMFKMDPKREPETITRVQQPIEEETIQEEEIKEEKDNAIQLSMFHENYNEEIKGIKTLADHEEELTKEFEEEEIEEPSETLTRDNLRKMTLVELKEMAKENDLHGYSRMKKAELIEFIIDNL